ncbi:hypothetical protein ETJ91_26025 [Bacillus albus]|nr:hypothetical protein ETJ91_26025 [Bacillus albus]RXJ22493.1 hypothetical protein ETJ90_28700 [Bacillus albus]RXJ24962.1 hypothetical protein ETJ76_25420 [Bacillus albus]RXJ36348.1 hypothetical protein ETJ89_25515 [Bacillus albus]RXJ52081.1 hypothetical protein ETJ66_26530 [Bacillus albus]
MCSRSRYTNSYGLRLLLETELLIAHGFSYKIKSYIRVLKEIWLLLSVDEGMRDTDSNFKAYKFDVYELNVKVFLI